MLHQLLLVYSVCKLITFLYSIRCYRPEMESQRRMEWKDNSGDSEISEILTVQYVKVLQGYHGQCSISELFKNITEVQLLSFSSPKEQQYADWKIKLTLTMHVCFFFFYFQWFPQFSMALRCSAPSRAHPSLCPAGPMESPLLKSPGPRYSTYWDKLVPGHWVYVQSLASQ